MLGCHLLAKPTRLRQSFAGAVAGDTSHTTVSNYSGEMSNSSDSSSIQKTQRNGESEEEREKVGTLDDQKMIRVCDKLIEVFLVDKPTPTDWRRLLAFSKEWDSIRPHFYRRCQERADGEDDPGMKHKLLRLGRKLKEVDGQDIFCFLACLGLLSWNVKI